MRIPSFASGALTLLATALSAQPAPLPPAAAARGLTPPVIVDAAAFLHDIPRGDTIADAGSLGMPWVFNDLALVLRSPSQPTTRVSIPEAGTYHLFVRSAGTAASSFRVAVGGTVSPATFGDGPLAWRGGGSFALPAGEVDIRLARVVPAPPGAPVFDVLALTKDSGFQESDLLPFQFSPAEVEVVKEYEIPRAQAVKFGDVDGDGRTDMLVLTPDYSAHVIDHDGRTLWSVAAPTEGARERSGFEAPGAIWDLDGDGRGEVLHWRAMEGKEWLVAADGRDGHVVRRTEWPTPPLPHVYNNFRIAIGRLHPGRASDVIVFTDSGGRIRITAYDATLRELWSHTEEKLKDHLGHYVYPVDLDGDGIDEVAVSALLLDAQGKVRWNRFDLFFDHHDHADSLRFADLDGDGKLEIVAPWSEAGVVALRASDGKLLWHHTAEHAQQLNVGRFLSGRPTPQVAVGARFYGDRQRGEPALAAQVHWLDAGGRFLAKWPANPLNGNPDFVMGDWRGDGVEQLFWYKFRLTPEGRGELYFADPVYHMFDFLGRGAEEVITLRPGRLRVHASRKRAGRAAGPRDPEYRRHRMTNHTHY